MTAPGDADWLPAGRVGKAHGLDGSFYVTRPKPGLLVLDGAIRVGTRETTVVRAAGTADKPILRLHGLVGREAVEPLRGTDLFVPRTEAKPLADGEYWAHDLEGCDVRDGGTVVGKVRTMLTLPSCDVLEVERDGVGDLLVPMVRDAIRSVDIGARLIEIDLVFLGEATEEVS